MPAQKLTLGSLDTKIDAGFSELSSQIENLAIAVKEGFDRVDERFRHIDKRFDHMDKRFDRVENISIAGHERRIDNLEDEIRLIKTRFDLRKNQ